MPSACGTRVLAAFVTLSLLAACGDTAGPSGCSGPVTVTVGPGARPGISWSPACLASDLLVDSPAPGGTIYWRITTANGTNGLRSPVTYGASRPGAISFDPLMNLVSGSFYTVTVSRADSSGHFAVAGTVTIVR